MSAVEIQPTSFPMSSSPSPGDSISLLEAKEDTRLVLNAFLRQTLTLPHSQRPGRVGGAYKDSSKFSASKKENQRWVDDGWDSLDEKISNAEEKKHGFKDLIKKRLRRRRLAGSVHQKKDTPNAEPKVEPMQKDVKPELPKLKDSENSHRSSTKSKLPKHEPEDGYASTPSSDDESERKDKKTKKKLSGFSSLIRKFRLSKKEDQHDENSRPKRPSNLAISPFKKPTDPASASPHSPSSHPPQFYEDVAETLDKIAQKHIVTKPAWPSSDSQPTITAESKDKEAAVRQLVDILSMQGDAINKKIKEDPFLKSTLASLSYPSFAKLLDMFADENEGPVPTQSDSTTLSHIAVTMEASRRILTANGTQRMQGYAERYMLKFVPLVQSQGGWEKIVQLQNLSEYD
ncbi:uncharacterized protein bcl2l12 isoform X2 [Paramormyrops kingsleyae]|uniref:BCL2 like 12 n=2 Tax=Paramormyrops kingsleyae TaxID=1676925 RepID=A0A3B3RTT9_9TELE|nr:bcl-2-like protein 12 isoform X2 [Paramormyrops kingsleyae]XP_023681915.1 bcl-2-like protein 12 isoform X2 [Paramormyrops kingsleyae]XP_023681916.1 bcl-2-like protein 12 isoform X2 [Paramormyrops kingsleyae]